MPYAFYSPSAARRSSILEYRRPDGVLVWLTCITLDAEGSGYEWPDKEFLGDASDWRYVREVRSGEGEQPWAYRPDFQTPR